MLRLFIVKPNKLLWLLPHEEGTIIFISLIKVATVTVQWVPLLGIYFFSDNLFYEKKNKKQNQQLYLQNGSIAECDGNSL